MNRKISVTLQDASSQQWNFTGFRELYEFIKAEAEYWQKRLSDISDSGPFHSYFNAQNNLSAFIHAADGWQDDWDDNHFREVFIQAQAQYLNNLQVNWLWSGHPFNDSFVECQKKHGVEAATAYIDYILRNELKKLQQPKGFLGIMLAYEFINQNSGINKRSSSEKKSLDQLRRRFDTTTTTLIGETEELKTDFNTWIQTAKEEWQKQLEHSSNEHNEQNKNHSEIFSKHMLEYGNRINELEKTYHEKLRLEKPAEYWKAAASRYEKQGWQWSIGLVLALLIGFISFFIFFTTWLKGQEIGLKLNTVHGVVLFATILAVYAFLIKTLSKLTFSCFHLMRDAEEREQLTYLFLALTNETNLEGDSRDIVLQALFSRAETGLLVSESGPTMPNITELLKIKSGQ